MLGGSQPADLAPLAEAAIEKAANDTAREFKIMWDDLGKLGRLRLHHGIIISILPVCDDGDGHCHITGQTYKKFEATMKSAPQLIKACADLEKIHSLGTQDKKVPYKEIAEKLLVQSGLSKLWTDEARENGVNTLAGILRDLAQYSIFMENESKYTPKDARMQKVNLEQVIPLPFSNFKMEWILKNPSLERNTVVKIKSAAADPTGRSSR